MMKWPSSRPANRHPHASIRVADSNAPDAWRPPTDIYECDEAYVVQLALCGLRRNPSGEIENAEVVVEGNALVIRGRVEDLCTSRKCSYHQMEISYGRFECRVEIDAPFSAGGIGAEYRDGFLIVTVPKRAPGAPRRIPVGR